MSADNPNIPEAGAPSWFATLIAKGETMPELEAHEKGGAFDLTRATPATRWILGAFTPEELAGQMLYMLMKQRVVRLDYQTGVAKGLGAEERAALMAERVAIRKARDSERRQRQREAKRERSETPRRVREPRLVPSAISDEIISYWAKHRAWPRTVDVMAEHFNTFLVEQMEEKPASINTIYRQVAREIEAGLLVRSRRKYSDKKWRVSLRIPGLERERNLRVIYPVPAGTPTPLELDAPATPTIVPQPLAPAPLALADEDEPL